MSVEARESEELPLRQEQEKKSEEKNLEKNEHLRDQIKELMLVLKEDRPLEIKELLLIEFIYLTPQIVFNEEGFVRSSTGNLCNLWRLRHLCHILIEEEYSVEELNKLLSEIRPDWNIENCSVAMLLSGELPTKSGKTIHITREVIKIGKKEIIVEYLSEPLLLEDIFKKLSLKIKVDKEGLLVGDIPNLSNAWILCRLYWILIKVEDRDEEDLRSIAIKARLPKRIFDCLKSGSFEIGDSYTIGMRRASLDFRYDGEPDKEKKDMENIKKFHISVVGKNKKEFFKACDLILKILMEHEIYSFKTQTWFQHGLWDAEQTGKNFTVYAYYSPHNPWGTIMQKVNQVLKEHRIPRGLQPIFDLPLSGHWSARSVNVEEDEEDVTRTTYEMWEHYSHSGGIVALSTPFSEEGLELTYNAIQNRALKIPKKLYALDLVIRKFVDREKLKKRLDKLKKIPATPGGKEIEEQRMSKQVFHRDFSPLVVKAFSELEHPSLAESKSRLPLSESHVAKNAALASNHEPHSLSPSPRSAISSPASSPSSLFSARSVIPSSPTQKDKKSETPSRIILTWEKLEDALCENNLEKFRTLLQQCDNPLAIVDIAGNTIAHFAAELGHIKGLEILKETVNPAIWTIKNNAGETPHDILPSVLPRIK